MSKGTCTTIQLLATGVIAFLSEKLGITFYLLGLLVFLMVVDYISGMIASMVEAIVSYRITCNNGNQRPLINP